MASTFSPSLRLELIGQGEQAGAWGTTTNRNLGTLLESAIAGYTAVTTTAAKQALTVLDGASDQARSAALALDTTTGAAYEVYAPPAAKVYAVRNMAAHTVTLYNSTSVGNTTAAGVGVAIPAGMALMVGTTGTDFYALGVIPAVGNTPNTVVQRDSSGNFAAGTITASLIGNVTGNVTGNAGTVTNGVYTLGNQTIGGVKTFSESPVVPAGATGTEVPQAQEVVGVTGATGSAKLPAGTTAQQDATPAVGYSRFDTDLDRLTVFDGTHFAPQRAVQSTEVDLTGQSEVTVDVPAWAQNYRVLFNGGSISNDTGHTLVQLGGASGAITTGYTSTSVDGVGNATSSTTGFIIYGALNSRSLMGALEINRFGSDGYVASGVLRMGGLNVANTGGAITTATTVTKIHVKPTSGTFDGGAICVIFS